MSVRDRFDRDTLNLYRVLLDHSNELLILWKRKKRRITKNQLILVKLKNSWKTMGGGSNF